MGMAVSDLDFFAGDLSVLHPLTILDFGTDFVVVVVVVVSLFFSVELIVVDPFILTVLRSTPLLSWLTEVCCPFVIVSSSSLWTSSQLLLFVMTTMGPLWISFLRPSSSREPW